MLIHSLAFQFCENSSSVLQFLSKLIYLLRVKIKGSSTDVIIVK